MMALLDCKFSFTTALIDSYSHQLHNSLLTKVAFSFSIQYSVLALPKQRWLSSLYWERLPISSTDLVVVLRARVLLLVSKYMRKYPTRIFKAAFYYYMNLPKGKWAYIMPLIVRSFARMCGYLYSCACLRVFIHLKEHGVVFKTCKGYPNSTFL
jgi:hypothetical protein